MPVLLGLEVVALSAVAVRLPAVRATAREAGNLLYDTLIRTNDAPQAQVGVASEESSATDSRKKVHHSKEQPPVAAPLLPELRADPEAAQRSPLRLREVLTQLAAAVPRRYGGEVGGVWSLLFSSSTDGVSLAHMLRTAHGELAFLLVVRDEANRVFGAFSPVLRDLSAAHGGGGGHLGIAAVGAALNCVCSLSPSLYGPHTL